MPHLLGPVPLVPEALRGRVPWQAALVHVPCVAGGAPLLPEPVEVAAQVHRDEEQLRLFRILCPRRAAQEVLVQHLHTQLHP